MLEIGNISNDSFQAQTLVTDDGLTIFLEIYYVPLQYSWIITELTYEKTTIKNMRICNSLNLLHQFKNILPFGIACVSEEDREPMLIDDFQSGHTKLYLLSEEETKQYSEFISGI